MNFVRSSIWKVTETNNNDVHMYAPPGKAKEMPPFGYMKSSMFFYSCWFLLLHLNWNDWGIVRWSFCKIQACAWNSGKGSTFLKSWEMSKTIPSRFLSHQHTSQNTRIKDNFNYGFHSSYDFPEAGYYLSHLWNLQWIVSKGFRSYNFNVGTIISNCKG